ncbi:hypothetical protein FKM82_005969 [Ascaphus truei]
MDMPLVRCTDELSSWEESVLEGEDISWPSIAWKKRITDPYNVVGMYWIVESGLCVVGSGKLLICKLEMLSLSLSSNLLFADPLSVSLSPSQVGHPPYQ